MSKDIKKEIGQLLVVGFHGKTLSKEIKDLIHNYHIGSVILFARNLGTLEEIRELTINLQLEAKAAGYEKPLLICLDQENGIVKRIGKNFGEYPGAMALGATNNPSFAYENGKMTASGLKSLGINWNLAPVVDVNNNSQNPVIGVRSYGEDPAKVADFGKAAMQGMQHEGLVTSLKHFPGHGDTSIDSHIDLPKIKHSLQRLHEVELVPFKVCIQAGADTIMIAHIVFPALETNEDRPATLSKNIVTGLLREKLGYDGVVTTDCLEMKAVATTFGTSNGAVEALKAGVDLVMVSHSYEKQVEVIQKIIEAIENKELSYSRIEQSFQRIKRLKSKKLSWNEELNTLPFSNFNYSAKQTMIENIFGHSVTVVKQGKRLDKDSHSVFVLEDEDANQTMAEDKKIESTVLSETVKEQVGNVETGRFSSTMLEEKDQLIEKVIKKDALIVGVNVLTKVDEWISLINEISQRIPTYVISMKNPYVSHLIPNVEWLICTYEPSSIPVKIAVKAFIGDTHPTGQLPVTI